MRIIIKKAILNHTDIVVKCEDNTQVKIYERAEKLLDFMIAENHKEWTLEELSTYAYLMKDLNMIEEMISFYEDGYMVGGNPTKHEYY